MTPEAILLSIRDRAGEGSYRFSCPTCLHTVEKPADRKVVALLRSAGVELDDKQKAEREAAERVRRLRALEPRPAGPSFTMDDLIAFHFLLEDDLSFMRGVRKTMG